MMLAHLVSSAGGEFVPGDPLLDTSTVPEDVAPISIEPVGRYAIQIAWSDGHDTGIYPFDRLRVLVDAGKLAP